MNGPFRRVRKSAMLPQGASDSKTPRDRAMSQLQDHPLRYELTNELHTRPFPSMAAPGTVVFLALKQSTEVGRDADADRALLINSWIDLGQTSSTRGNPLFRRAWETLFKVGTTYGICHLYVIS